MKSVLVLEPLTSVESRLYSVSDLLKFRGDLDLSPEAFREITSVNINRIRRGRSKGPFEILRAHFDIMNRCQALYSFALSLRGNRDDAQDWMFSSAPALKGACPINLTRTAELFTQVEDLITILTSAATTSVSRSATQQATPVFLRSENSSPPPPSPNPTVAPSQPTLIPSQHTPSPRPNNLKLRIAERLKEVLAKHPGLSKTELARKMQQLGFPKISASSISRFGMGYEASREEITALATILEVTSEWLSDAAVNVPPTR